MTAIPTLAEQQDAWLRRHYRRTKRDPGDGYRDLRPAPVPPRGEPQGHHVALALALIFAALACLALVAVKGDAP